MEDKQYELLNKMVVKINEARTYNQISGFLTLLWLVEFFYSFLYIQKFDTLYWVIWIFCMVGWYHMNKKFRFAMDEYQEMKKEYETRFENEND
jgi:hypothetical protein